MFEMWLEGLPSFGSVAMYSCEFGRARSFVAIPKSQLGSCPRSYSLRKFWFPLFRVQQGWAVEIPGGAKVSGKTVIRSSGKTPAVASRLVVCSILLVLASCLSLIAQRGIDGRARRKGHGPEWSSGAGSEGCCAQPRDWRGSIHRDKPCGTLPVSGDHAGSL